MAWIDIHLWGLHWENLTLEKIKIAQDTSVSVVKISSQQEKNHFELGNPAH